MRITDEHGRDPIERVREILHDFHNELDGKGQKIVTVSIGNTIKRHFQSIYPGSKHYSPDKVKVLDDTHIDIDVPGISRAFHDLNIRAKNGKYLTIPMHRDAFGVKARNMSDLFYAENKNGTKMLAKNESGALVVMYILKESVHQRRDPSLLPTKTTMLLNAINRLKTYLLESR